MSAHTSEGYHGFPPTQWPLVERAAAGDEAAMGELYTRYKSPLRAHLRFKLNLPPDRTEELLQNFIGDKLVKERCIEAACARKGKFRNFLLTTLVNYAVSEIRKELAAKRHPEKGLLSLDDSQIGDVAAQPTDDQLSEDWARDLVAETLRRVQSHYQSRNRPDMWTVFERRIVSPALDGHDPMPYDHLVREFGFQSPQAAFNSLMDAKRTFRRCLREVISEYAKDQSEMETELKELQALLSRHRARS